MSRRRMFFAAAILASATFQAATSMPLQVDVTKMVACPRSQKAQEGDQLTVHYGGFLMEGTKFDSSFDRGEPFTFELGVGQVIPGWDQGLLGVCPGEERHLVVPPNLAYGSRGAGDVIPADATLLFDIVVVDVTKAKDLVDEADADEAKEEEVEEEEDDDDLDSSSCGGEQKLKTKVLSRPSKCFRRSKKGDKLSMHYEGRLSSTGSKFDSSLDRGDPFRFTLGVGQVIRGWDEGVAGMCVGERRQLEVPPALAYGADGVGDVIPPCSTLVFQVELLEVDEGD